jgi:hypothetical protein
VGVLALTSCHLGVDAVTYELVDPDDFDWPLGPRGIASGDVDGDDDLDLVPTGRDGYAVLTNDGTGAYSIDFPNGFSATMWSPSLADVDADGYLDLVVLVGGEEGLPVAPAILRNDGTGTFGAVEVAPVGPGEVRTLVVSDVDGDGDADLLTAVGVAGDRHVGVQRNDGTGAFAAPQTYRLDAAFAPDVFLVAGDLDGDGDDDVVTTEARDVPRPDGERIGRTFATVALNDGTGHFATAGAPLDIAFDGDFGALSPVLADLDGDGNLDLAVGGVGSMTTLLGDGVGGFGPPRRSVLPNTRTIDQLVAADIDQDGLPDLVGFNAVLDPTAGVVAFSDGTGGLEDVHIVGSGTRIGNDGTPAREVEVTDLEGDGDSDLLFLAGSLGVVENAMEGRRLH